MKRVFKIFWMWDYEKEEKWLNDMSHQGWQLQRYTPFVYHFKQGEPDAYQYCLEFMAPQGGSKGMEDYLQFLAESGIECVGRYFSWGYFRRENDGQPGGAPGPHADLNRGHPVFAWVFGHQFLSAGSEGRLLTFNHCGTHVLRGGCCVCRRRRAGLAAQAQRDAGG